MRPLYRLQQRLAITTPEASALLFLAAVLLTGFAAQHFQSQAVPFDEATYAALHDELAARAVPADSTESDSTATDTASAATAAAAPSRSRRAKDAPVRMNLNTASERLLQRLPRIGPALSARIVAYREAHGPFAQPSHIVRVRGIGPKTFEQMEPYLFVDEADLVTATDPD